MNPAVEASLRWGLVGALSFLVLVQGYQFVSGQFVGIGVLVGVALAVGVCSALLTHLLRPVVLRWNERP
jgi:hypothetical protein